MNKYIELFKKISGRPQLILTVKNIVWLMLDHVWKMALSLVAGLLVARHLEPKQFGLLSYAVAFVGMFGTFASLGMQGLVVRNIVTEPKKSGLIIGTALRLQFYAGIISYITLTITIWMIKPDDQVLIMAVAIIGLTLIIRSSDVIACWFEAKVISKHIVWIQSSAVGIAALIKIVFVYLGASLLFFPLVDLFAAILITIGTFLNYYKFRGEIKRLSWCRSTARSLLLDCWPMIFTGLAIGLYMRIDQIMLGQMLGNEAVGLYSAALKLSEPIYVIYMLIASTLFPGILTSINSKAVKYKGTAQFLYDVMSIISILMLVALTIFSGLLVDLLYGESYAASADVFVVHIWTGLFVSLGIASEKILLINGQQILSMYRSVLGAIVNIGLNLLLIPEYGIMGAAIATVISQATAALFFDAILPSTRPMFFMKLKSIYLFGSMKRVYSSF